MPSKPQFVGERVRLGDVLKSSSTRNKDNKCVNVYSVTNSKGFVPSEEYFSKEVFSKELRTYRVVARGMIAYNPSRINVGSVALQDKADEVVVSPLYVVFSTDESKLMPEYLVHFLKSKPGLDQIAFQSIGTVRINLKFKALCQMELHIPPLGEQQARLNTLREIQLQIERAESQIAKLDQLVKSRFVEMFGDLSGYESRALEECVSVIESGKSPKCLVKPREGNGPGVLKLSAISSGVYKETENKALPLDAKVTDGKMVCDGDILLARKNTPELVGQSVLVNHTDGNIMFPDIVFRMRVRPEVGEIYLSHVLSHSLAGAIKSLAHGSAKSMSNIPKSKLAKLLIPVPPLALQQEFAVFASQVDKSRFFFLGGERNEVLSILDVVAYVC